MGQEAGYATAIYRSNHNRRGLAGHWQDFFCLKAVALSSNKSKPIGDGQHSTARWATPKEISKTFHHVPFRPAEWRKGENRPKVQELLLRSPSQK